MIDVLLKRRDGWVIVDYKTSPIRQTSQSAAEMHAQRYYMQVGCYAEAAREQLGVEPEVYIHYLRHGLTAAVPPEAWREALASMESTIGRIAGDT